MEKLVLTHGIQEPSRRIHAGERAREHANHGGEVHTVDAPTQSRSGRHVAERRRARAKVFVSSPMPNTMKYAIKVKNKPAKAPQTDHGEWNVLARIGGLLGQRRRALEAHEAENHERQRREHCAVLEGSNVQLCGIDDGTLGTWRPAR